MFLIMTSTVLYAVVVKHWGTASVHFLFSWNQAGRGNALFCMFIFLLQDRHPGGIVVSNTMCLNWTCVKDLGASHLDVTKWKVSWLGAPTPDPQVSIICKAAIFLTMQEKRERHSKSVEWLIKISNLGLLQSPWEARGNCQGRNKT